MCNRVDRMQGLGFGGEARAGFGFAIGLRLKTKASHFGRKCKKSIRAKSIRSAGSSVIARNAAIAMARFFE